MATPSVSLPSLMVADLLESHVRFSDVEKVTAIPIANNQNPTAVKYIVKIASDSKFLPGQEIDMVPIWTTIGTLLLAMDTSSTNAFASQRPTRYESVFDGQRVSSPKDSELFWPSLTLDARGWFKTNVNLYVQCGPESTRFTVFGISSGLMPLARMPITVPDYLVPNANTHLGILPITLTTRKWLIDEVRYIVGSLIKAVPGVDHWLGILVALASLHALPHVKANGDTDLKVLIPSQAAPYTNAHRVLMKGVLEVSSPMATLPNVDRIVNVIWALNTLQDVYYKSQICGQSVDDPQLLNWARAMIAFNGGFVRFRGSIVDRRVAFRVNIVSAFMGRIQLSFADMESLFCFFNFMCGKRAVNITAMVGVTNIIQDSHPNEQQIVNIRDGNNVQVGGFCKINPFMSARTHFWSPQHVHVAMPDSTIRGIDKLLVLSEDVSFVKDFYGKLAHGFVSMESLFSTTSSKTAHKPPAKDKESKAPEPKQEKAAEPKKESAEKPKAPAEATTTASKPMTDM